MAKSRLQGTHMNPTRFHRSQIKFYAVLLPMAVLTGLPIVYIFSHALKPYDELFAYPPAFLVHRPTLENFSRLFETMGNTQVPGSRYLFNSVVFTLAAVALALIVSAAAAYAFSKKKFRLNSTLFEINTLALMFVPTAVMIPRYLIIAKAGILDTFWAQILPFAPMPMGIFLIKQFVDQLPDSLIEAARIDGAGDIKIFMKIIIPLVKPALATVAILAFQTVWSSVEASTIFINKDQLKTFGFYMSTLSANSGTAGQGMAAAAALLMFIPNLIIFICMQSRVMDTMAHSGIK